MAPLVPCPQCKRHIKVDHDVCPFCRSLVPQDFASGIIPAAKARLDRLATFTFATTFAIACSTGGGGEAPTGGDSGASDGGRSDSSVKDDGGVQALYGGPVDAGVYDVNVQPPYGSPPDDGGGVPAYGQPFDAGSD